MFSVRQYVSLQQRLTIFFFFFNDTATTEIYTLSLHDALPISKSQKRFVIVPVELSPNVTSNGTKPVVGAALNAATGTIDRKSTRLNSSHSQISYAVFCLKKKKSIINLIIALSQMYTQTHVPSQ